MVPAGACLGLLKPVMINRLTEMGERFGGSGLPTAIALAVVNHVLDDAAWARAMLVRHSGSIARVVCGSWEIEFSVGDEGFLVVAQSPDGGADLLLEVPVDALPVLLVDRESALRLTKIHGKVEFAEALGSILRNLRWDLEEDLSRVIGDIAARRVTALGLSVHQTAMRSANEFEGSLGEWLRHEAGIAPSQAAVTEICRRIDDLRDDVERLEVRIRKLAARR